MRNEEKQKSLSHGEQPPPDLEEQIIDALREIHDPEIPVNIYDLGLIYHIDADPEQVLIRMTLICPGCPVAGFLPIEVRNKLKQIEGVKSVQVVLVWDPPWNSDMISEAGKLQLGLY